MYTTNPVTRCCACGTTIRFPATEYESALYSPVQYLLCEPCGEREEQEITRQGTNNIPELLNTYVQRN
jgi:hypothetical protein